MQKHMSRNASVSPQTRPAGSHLHIFAYPDKATLLMVLSQSPGRSRFAPSLCISHFSKSDIHESIMNPLDESKNLLSREIDKKSLVKKSFSPHIIP